MSNAAQNSQPAALPCPNSSSSFWHSEPSPFLLQHRTTPELPSAADVVIIGSGITGASAARYLAEDPRANGLKVVLLEAREACWGATGRNGGHCQPLLLSRTPEVAAFEIKNVSAVKSYIEQHEVLCEWRDVTACHIFWGKSLWKTVKQLVAALRESHPELGALVETLDDAKLYKERRVSPSATGMTLTQGAASLWPYKYVTFILEKLVRDGALNLQTNTPVTGIESSPTNEHVLTTPRGKIAAKKVIFATNGYTSRLLKEFAPLIVPMRCEMSALHPPAGSERLPHSYGTMGSKELMQGTDDYLIQRPFYDDINGRRRGGHLMFGGGRPFAELATLGQTEDDVVDQGEASYLRKALLELLDLGGDTKGLKELTASHQWTGIKGYSRDDMPWVGKLPGQEGLYISAGYTGHGMPNATLCGKAAVEMLLAEAGGEDYAVTCDTLVAAGDLPRSYVVTPERLEAALTLPTIAEQEAAKLADIGASVKAADRQCAVM